MSSSSANVTSLYAYSMPVTITIGILASLVAVVTTALNIITLLAFCFNKSLRNFGDYFILNLAIADLAIGAFSIPPYIPYLLTLHWSSGKPFCLYWLLWDYVTPAASAYNVCIISIDRYLLVAQPIRYRNCQSSRLLLVIMLSPWAIVTLVYVPAILLYETLTREATIEEGQCYVPYAHNVSFLLFGSFVEFILPFSTLVVINLLIVSNIRKRTKKRMGPASAFIQRTAPSSVFTTQVAPMNIPASGASSPYRKKGCGHKGQKQGQTMITYENQTNTGIGTRNEPDSKLKDSNLQLLSLPNGTSAAIGQCDKQGTSKHTYQLQGTSCAAESSKLSAAIIINDATSASQQCEEMTNMPPGSGSKTDTSVRIATATPSVSRMSDSFYSRPLTSTTSTTKAANPAAKATFSLRQNVLAGEASVISVTNVSTAATEIQQTASRYYRDRKAARSLFVLVIVFAVCWLPYEIFALVAAVCEDCIHPVLFETSFWLLWLNSAVNPVLYPLLHSRFRAAFISMWRRVGCCQQATS